MSIVAVADPFQLFPEEIWEMILKRVEDVKDVRNVLKAYPKLDLGFQKMKRFWLFDQIIPFLTTWSHMISEQDLLNCRQVYKPWSKVVDEFLENQPYFRAHNPELQTEDELRLNLAANLHRRYPHPFDAHFGSQRLEYLGGTRFFHHHALTLDAHRSLGRFLREMGNRNHESNPFLTRSVSIKFGEMSSTREFTESWGELMQTVSEFGEHIRSFTIVMTVPRPLAPDFLQLLTHALNLLPELRYLNLKIWYQVPPSVEGRLFERPEVLPLPHLPQLETLKLYSNWRHCELLTLHFSSQLRRLEWNLNRDGRDFPRVLPNLTELDVVVREEEEFPLLTSFLLSMEAPQLTKLDILFEWTEQSHSFGIEEDVFVWLNHFPCLKSFSFGSPHTHGRLRENGSLSPENNSFLSLQFLSVPDSHGLNYNFLRCLPSLQHLALILPLEPMVYDLSNEDEIKIREQIQNGTIYNSNIWEVLPQLRSVTKQIVFPAFKIHTILTYERETYQYFKERGIESHDELRFRPDHPKYLELMRRTP